jgi:hypothetical protein
MAETIDLSDSPEPAALAPRKRKRAAAQPAAAAVDEGDDDVVVLGEVKRARPALQQARELSAEHVPMVEVVRVVAGSTGRPGRGRVTRGLSRKTVGSLSRWPHIRNQYGCLHFILWARKANEALFSPQGFECPICLCDCAARDGYTLICAHSFCAGCAGPPHAPAVQQPARRCPAGC